MARRSKKTILLDIMKEILDEYKKSIHRTSISNCGLCLEYRTHNCYACPMFVFKSNCYYACMDRKCIPTDCELTDPSDIELLRVKLFYKKAIAKIESMSNSNFLKTNFAFLIKIDEEVYNELR